MNISAIYLICFIIWLVIGFRMLTRKQIPKIIYLLTWLMLIIQLLTLMFK